VDTHIFRVANRTRIAPGKTPRDVEDALVKFTPGEFAHDAHHWLILHGRYVCKALTPACQKCLINDLCEYGPADYRRRSRKVRIFGGMSRPAARDGRPRGKAQGSADAVAARKQVVAVISEHPEYRVIESAASDLANYSPRGGRSAPGCTWACTAIREQVATNRPAGIAEIHGKLAYAGGAHQPSTACRRCREQPGKQRSGKPRTKTSTWSACLS
jgi:hypothetical protein